MIHIWVDANFVEINQVHCGAEALDLAPQCIATATQLRTEINPPEFDVSKLACLRRTQVGLKGKRGKE